MARLTIPDEPTSIEFTVTTARSEFPISFSLFSKADLRVRVGGANIQQSAFTFTGTLLEGGGYKGGIVTLNSPVSSTSVRVSRRVKPVRPSNFPSQNSVPVRTVDMELNKIVAQQQDVMQALVDVEKGVVDPDTIKAAAETAAAGKMDRVASVLVATQSHYASDTKRLVTEFYSPSYAVPATMTGGAFYRESDAAEVAGYPALSWFTTNGGSRYWLLDARPVEPEMFGARGDWDGSTGTDDTAAMQAFFDFMEIARRDGRLGQKRYRLTGTIYGGRKGGFRLTGVAKTFPADNQWASTLIFDVPDGTNGLFLANEVATARRDGIEIDGLQIYRVNKEPLGGGGVGITYKGLVQPIIKNVTVHRFDINGYITEATGGGATSGGVFDTVRYEGGATAGCVLDACIESDFRHGKFGNGKYGLWIKRSPTNYRPNGNYFAKLTFISDGPAPNDCDHNLFDDNSRGYFNCFSECAFEGARLQNIHGRGSAEVAIMNATFDNCWFNAGIGGTLLFDDYNHQVGGGSRVHSNSATSPCVTLKRTTASANALVAIISGNHITYLTECGVKIDGWNGAVITDNVCQDRSTGFDLPFAVVTAATGGERNIVANNRLRTGHQPGYVDLSGPQLNSFRNNPTSSGSPVSLGPDLIGSPSRTVGGATAARQTHGSNGNGSSELLSRGSNDAGPPRRFFYKTRATTPTARVAVQSADEIGALDFYADDGSADIRAGYVRAVVDGAPSSGVVPLGLAFGTRDSGGINDRLYISPNGMIGVATTSPQFRMDVRGPVAFMPEGGDPQINGQMVMQTTASGIRFKWKDPATGNVRLTAYLPWT